MTSITGVYFSKCLLNCDGSGTAAVGLMDVLTLIAAQELEIKVRSERVVFGAWKRALLSRFLALAAGTRSGLARLGDNLLPGLAVPFG